MHEHDLDVAPQRVEARRDGLLPALAAGDDRDEVAAVAGGLERVGERVALAAGGRDDDDLRGRAGEDARERMPQHRVLVDADERLRDPRAQTRARSGCDDDDRDAGHRRDAHALTLPPASTQEARTSSRMTPACSSSVFSASASSEMRICFAFASMRFSPAERPRS